MPFEAPLLYAEVFGSAAGWWNFRGDEPQFNLFEEIDLPDEVRKKIYRGNAARLFGFETAGEN